MRLKHDCPYLEHGMICTHKGSDPAKSKVRRRCTYRKPRNCPLLRDCKSEAVNLQFLEKDCLECPESLLNPKGDITND